MLSRWILQLELTKGYVIHSARSWLVDLSKIASQSDLNTRKAGDHFLYVTFKWKVTRSPCFQFSDPASNFLFECHNSPLMLSILIASNPIFLLCISITPPKDKLQQQREKS